MSPRFLRMGKNEATSGKNLVRTGTISDREGLETHPTDPSRNQKSFKFTIFTKNE